jgi:hypothetical protein
MKPSWRKPFGVLALLAALSVYAAVAAAGLQATIAWPVPAQVAAYLAAGTVWLLPMRGFLNWMETGRWR